MYTVKSLIGVIPGQVAPKFLCSVERWSPGSLLPAARAIEERLAGKTDPSDPWHRILEMDRNTRDETKLLKDALFAIKREIENKRRAVKLGEELLGEPQGLAGDEREVFFIAKSEIQRLNNQLEGHLEHPPRLDYVKQAAEAAFDAILIGAKSDLTPDAKMVIRQSIKDFRDESRIFSS